ncbi:hypothetical protein V1511DRAFT_246766 [Dipodascopsis uninucleata]
MKAYTAVSIVLIITIAVMSYSYISSSNRESASAVSRPESVIPEPVAPAVAPTAAFVEEANVKDSSAERSFIVTFKAGKDTPDSVVKEVMQKFMDYGGQITHQYNTVLKGFSFSIPSGFAAKGTISAMISEAQKLNLNFPFVVEEDKPVSK